MRRLFALIFISLLSFSAFPQDGIYGSFLLGTKFIGLGPLNDYLEDMNTITGNTDISNNPLPNNSLTLGGEGHLILAKRLVLGGRGFGISHERQVQNSTTERRIRVTSAMAVANVGFNLLKENRFGFHLYPQVGMGVSSFIFQMKDEIANESDKTFDYVVENGDNMTSLARLGLIIDFSAAFDWYKPFKNFFTIVPGLDVGLLAHVEVGYSLLPAQLKWRRDVDVAGKDQVENGPDLKFNGFYMNIGLGLGLSPQ